MRPFGFEGSWPDKYMRGLTGLERAVHYWQISAGSPELSVPPPRADVSVWDARDHAVLVPWFALLQVLRAAAYVRRSLRRYQDYVWAHGRTFVAKGPVDR